MNELTGRSGVNWCPVAAPTAHNGTDSIKTSTKNARGDRSLGSVVDAAPWGAGRGVSGIGQGRWGRRQRQSERTLQTESWHELILAASAPRASYQPGHWYADLVTDTNPQESGSDNTQTPNHS